MDWLLWVLGIFFGAIKNNASTQWKKCVINIEREIKQSGSIHDKGV